MENILKKRHRFMSQLLQADWITPTVREHTYSCPAEFSFYPGQYMNVFLTQEEKPVARSYSIASSADVPNLLKFVIKQVASGTVTNDFLNMPLGSEVKMMGPFGRFCLIDDHLPEKDLVFVGTGTGLSPLMSMIETLLARDFPYRISLITGVRTVRERLYQDHWTEMAEKHPRFSYYSVVSQAEDPAYKGLRGRVQSVFDTVIRPPQQCVYICGLQAMVNAVEKDLLQRGLPQEQIFYEKYDA